MKPDWDKLMDEFKDSKTSLVADVDCTAGGQPLCEKHGVRGYPTIKWGDPNDLKDYDGGRSFDDFKKFAEENLGPTCSPENKDLCKDEDKALIEKFQAMTNEELEKAMADVDAKVTKIQAKSKKTIEGLQAKIKEYEDQIAAVEKKKDEATSKESKKLGLKVMRAVARSKKKQDSDSGKKKKKKGKKS
jgi:hypothetical protein